jgi:hypothetical protein
MLTTAHLYQQEVIQQAKRFNVVCCGRRYFALSAISGAVADFLSR